MPSSTKALAILALFALIPVRGVDSTTVTVPSSSITSTGIPTSTDTPIYTNTTVSGVSTKTNATITSSSSRNATNHTITSSLTTNVSPSSVLLSTITTETPPVVVTIVPVNPSTVKPTGIPQATGAANREAAGETSALLALVGFLGMGLLVL